MEYPIHVSNVNLVDPEFKWGTRIYWAFDESGKRVRVSKWSGSIIPKPFHEHLTYSAWTSKKTNSTYDTLAEDVLKVTYQGENFQKVFDQFWDFIKIKEEKEKLLVFRD